MPARPGEPPRGALAPIAGALAHTGTGAPYEWALDGYPADSVGLASSGQTRTVTFTTPSPGRYQFVCTIHQRQGMVATVIVLPGGGG